MLPSRYPLVALLLVVLHLLPTIQSFRQHTMVHKGRSLLKPLLPRLLARPSACADGVSSGCRGSLHSHEEELLHTVRPTLADYTRTIVHICKSGTLSTISEDGHPMGTSVDYVLDQKGHPIFFFSKTATAISKDSRASFFCKIPLEYEHMSSLSSKSASIQGQLMPVSKKEINSLKIAFSLTHPHSTNNMCDNEDVYFAKLHPEHISYSTGDFGAKPIPIDMHSYERAFPDILAPEVPTLLPRLNIAKQYELRLICKHMLHIEGDVETVTLQAIDKLGIDIRTTRGKR